MARDGHTTVCATSTNEDAEILRRKSVSLAYPSVSTFIRELIKLGLPHIRPYKKTLLVDEEHQSPIVTPEEVMLKEIEEEARMEEELSKQSEDDQSNPEGEA